ncbi:Metal-dependent hydrolase [Candidatus Nanohalovita haloferacivicina]|nr:Metal-dependent hydrolase [Candidatus Nanohalobia archaeon BNXNv]
MEAKIDGLKINYSIRNSSEASKPRIDHKLGDFTVVIPEDQDLDAEELLKQKESWVAKKRKEFLRFKRKIPDRNLSNGSKITILGEEKEITVQTARKNQINDKIILAEHLVEQTSLKDQLEKALRERAREVIEQKIEDHKDKVDGEHEEIFIRDQQTKWGSCSSKSNLNFNWRLVLAPQHVLEYVVVHELVHLEERNHSEKFWSRVRGILPKYQRSNKWLAKNSAQLVFDKSLILENEKNTE